MGAFGSPVEVFSSDAADGTSATAAEEDMDRVRSALTALNNGGTGSLRIFRPRPTAAFAPRDTTIPRYADAAKALREKGFAPLERRAGGQLAVYDESALVIDLVAHHPDPRLDVIERFRLFSETIAGTLRGFAIDARVGGVAGEYCPGDYSINGEGRVKLVGVAQRVGRRSFHLGAVVSVMPSAAIKEAIVTAYHILDFDFEPCTMGAVSDLAGNISFAVLRKTLLQAMAVLLPQSDSTTASASISTS